MSDNFLSRWSRRKLEAKELAKTPETLPAEIQATELSSIPREAPTSGVTPPVAVDVVQESASAISLPSEADLAAVEKGGDIKAFMTDKVSDDLKNKAFKALFSRPEFNVMDGLDIYIDDYNKFIPLSQEDVAKMTFSKQLLSRPDLEIPEVDGHTDLVNPVLPNTYTQSPGVEVNHAVSVDEPGVVDRHSSESVSCADENDFAEMHRVIPDNLQVTENQQKSLEQSFEKKAEK